MQCIHGAEEDKKPCAIISASDCVTARCGSRGRRSIVMFRFCCREQSDMGKLPVWQLFILLPNLNVHVRDEAWGC